MILKNINSFKAVEMKKSIVTFALILLIGLGDIFAAGHPNNIINQAQVDEIKKKIQAGAQPWKKAYDKMMSDANGDMSGGFPSVTSNGSVISGTDSRYYASAGGYSGGDKRDIGVIEDASRMMINLGLAYSFSGQTKYADRAIDLVKYFCLSNTTGMIPSGKNWGGGGIVHLLFGLQGFFFGADFIIDYPGWKASEKAAFIDWITKTIELNKVSVKGDLSFRYENNWEDWRMCHVGFAAIVIEDETLLNSIFDRWKEIFPTHIGNTGQMLDDITRDQGFTYSLFGLEPYSQVAAMARNRGMDLFNYNGGGKSLKKAWDFHAYFMADWSSRKSEFLNTTIEGKTKKATATANPGKEHAGLFEIAYSIFKDPDYLKVLNKWGRPSVMMRKLGHPTLTHGNWFDLPGGTISGIAAPIISPSGGNFKGSKSVTITTQLPPNQIETIECPINKVRIESESINKA